MVDRPARTLRSADAGTIGQRVGRVINRYKVAKHFELEIADGRFTYQRKTRPDHRRGRARRPLRDPHHLPDPTALSARRRSRAYKQLKMAERAFRTMKDTIEVRPIHHHLEDRVRAHVFLCMLAYYVAFELHARLTPLLFTDETPLAPADPVAPARRSPAAKTKAGAHTHPRRPTPPTTSPTCSPNSARSAATSSASAPANTPSPDSAPPPPLQARALDLLDITLHT